MEHKEIDCLLHFNKVEALGRIFLEASEYGKPLIGFNKGGIKEVAYILGQEDMLVSDGESWESSMWNKLLGLKQSWTEIVFGTTQTRLENAFSPRSYTSELEKIFDL